MLKQSVRTTLGNATKVQGSALSIRCHFPKELFYLGVFARHVRDFENALDRGGNAAKICLELKGP